ncbi:MAG: DUF456 domain-containing protein [Bacillota bacterium]
MDSLYMALSYILMIIGLIGTVLPMLPGLILILAGIILYGWHVGFSVLGIDFLLTMLMLTIIGTFVEILTSAIGAKKFGASTTGTISAIIGVIFGLIFLGPIGLIIGPVLTVTLTELLKGKDLLHAFKVVLGVLLGSLSGIAIRLFIGIAMIVAFTIKIFFLK